MNRHKRSAAAAGSRGARRAAIRSRRASRSRMKAGPARQVIWPRLVSKAFRRLSISAVRAAGPCSAASSIRRRRLRSTRVSATFTRISARRSAPRPTRFSTVTFFWLPGVARCMAGKFAGRREGPASLAGSCRRRRVGLSPSSRRPWNTALQRPFDSASGLLRSFGQRRHGAQDATDWPHTCRTAPRSWRDPGFKLQVATAQPTHGAHGAAPLHRLPASQTRRRAANWSRLDSRGQV